MTVTHDAESWRVEVPGLVDGLGGPYRKYMVPSNDTCRIYNAPRPEVVPGLLTVGQATRNVVTGARSVVTGIGRCALPSILRSTCVDRRPSAGVNL